jgi:hypothetical protein
MFFIGINFLMLQSGSDKNHTVSHTSEDKHARTRQNAPRQAGKTGMMQDFAGDKIAP